MRESALRRCGIVSVPHMGSVTPRFELDADPYQPAGIRGEVSSPGWHAVHFEDVGENREVFTGAEAPRFILGIDSRTKLKSSQNGALPLRGELGSGMGRPRDDSSAMHRIEVFPWSPGPR